MKFRTKALISLIIIITFIFLVIAVGSYLLFSANIQSLERDYVSTQIEKSHILFNGMQDRYTSTVQDWGWWDETYTYMTTSDSIQQEQYITQNLNDESLGIIGINIVFLLSPDGTPVQMFLSEEAEQYSDILYENLVQDRSLSAFIWNQDLSHSHSWISLIGDTPVLFAETNILQSSNRGPSAGTLIMGHILSSDDIQYLASLLDADISIPDTMADNSLSPGIYKEETPNRTITIIPLSDEKIIGKSLIFGYTADEQIPFSLSLQRNILAKGKETWEQNLLFLILSGLCILLLSLFAFDRLFLSRMTLLSTRVHQLQEHPETNPDSLMVSGDDEIHELSCALYDLVTRLTKKTKQASESEKRFFEMTNLLPTPVFETDTKGIITFSNAAFQEMFGLTDFPNGMNLASMLSEDGAEEMDRMLFIPQDMFFLHSRDLYVKSSDGTRIPVIVTCVPIYNEKSECIGNRGVIIDISEIKEKEDEIKASEEKYRNLTELLPVAVFETDSNGIITYANTAALTLWHYSHEEITEGITLETLIETPDSDAKMGNLPLVFPVGAHVGEYQVKRRDGSLFAAMIRSDDLIPSNPTQGRRGVIIDISAMKEVQDAVAESEKRFRELTELLPITVFEIDASATLTFVNSAAFRMFQYTKDDFINGINLFQLLSPESIPQALEDVASVLHPDKENQKEYMMTKKDETVFPAVIISSPVFSEGFVTGRRGVILDLSDIKRTESALIESEERLNLAVEAANLGIWNYNIVTEQTTVNDQFTRIIGYNLDDFYAERMTFISIIHPDDRKSALSSIASCITGESERFMSEYRMITKQGKIIWTLNIGKITKWGTDKVPQKMSGITMDMTENHQIRAALIETNRKLNLLSSMTRHDITNSLSGIFLTLEVFSEHISDDPTAHEFVQLIYEGMQNIHSQITFTKDYEDLGATEPAWYSVSDQIQAAVASLPDKKITFVNKVESLAIFADPLIGRVFFNLLDNAVRHGGKTLTTITVDYSYEGDDLLLHIRNDGEGIPPEEKEEIFKRGIGKNTGLGLFLAREILAITSIDISECGHYPGNVIFDLRVPKGNYTF